MQTGLDIGDMVFQWSKNADSVRLDYSAGVGGAGTTTTDPALISSHIVGAESLEGRVIIGVLFDLLWKIVRYMYCNW